MPTSYLYRRPSRANELLVQGHARDMQPENEGPCRFPAMWAVVTNDLCIKRCRAEPNDVTPIRI